MEKVSRRLSIIRGQVEGIIKMINKGEYCIDVINQSRAIQKSLKSLDRLVLEKHFKTCVTEILRSHNQKERERIIKELLSIYEICD